MSTLNKFTLAQMCDFSTSGMISLLHRWNQSTSWERTKEENEKAGSYWGKLNHVPFIWRETSIVLLHFNIS